MHVLIYRALISHETIDRMIPVLERVPSHPQKKVQGVKVFKAHAVVADWSKAYWPANARHTGPQARTTLKLEHLWIFCGCHESTHGMFRSFWS
jgi:hypothetical protein